MILESLITTVDADGNVNLAPLGPIVVPSDAGEDRPGFLLRPYEGSRTCSNLLSTGHGVIHVVDDALLVARTAIGKVDAVPLVQPVDGLEVSHVRLKDCHRWFAIRVTEYGGETPRHEMVAECLRSGLVRPFFGFNRAKHAVIEAAVAATRLHLLPAEEVQEEIRRAEIAIDKTGGPDELEALRLIQQHVQKFANS
ncbi:DUF447 family protein [Rhodopirellula sp. JC740]|uniref:DUF447 family protein n=1 Tax=Rhodopirellula halodulae TaxID=2894198 RepID=A0ABS8NNA8_9BACT|nr:DUF447 domain-containing protein [Rhodopirellula sp. JC740]MCC9645068.1 DUF447 family protein [Rhodopirellula sp. JC740]